MVELVIADSGPGLPSTNLRDLLMRSTKPQGMGVGLLTVQSIACRHSGAPHLGRSQHLGGAERRLRLPLASRRTT
jgi:nitrogen-specific signal transduction histidine kinase